MRNCACEICDHDLGFRCGMQNANYGRVNDPNECDDFDDADDTDDLDDGEEPIDVTQPIECPIDGGNAYWNGHNYECESCDWCGMP